jgi:hypothetical protein
MVTYQLPVWRLIEPYSISNILMFFIFFPFEIKEKKDRGPFFTFWTSDGPRHHAGERLLAYP